MTVQFRFAHVNLVAREWKSLAIFYENVFGMQRLLPERDLSGPWLEQAVNIPGAHIRGVHLLLPGFNGPTLEIFQYQPQEAAEANPPANRPGFGHIAFQVEDVEKACAEILQAGGSMLGEVVALSIPEKGQVTFAYLRDPEGNIIELQRWD